MIHYCDNCGKQMKFKNGCHGKFYGCTGFPVCRNTLSTHLAHKKELVKSALSRILTKRRREEMKAQKKAAYAIAEMRKQHDG
jgi:ssDNA-binding Zn-finger/Zn-ribbon topoisomerase 1